MKITYLTLASALVLVAASAAAEDQPGGMSHMGKSMHHMSSPSSMHDMPATVSSVDAATGLVEVSSAGMSLKLHFPPNTLTGLKAGDKITIHMGFTKS